MTTETTSSSVLCDRRPPRRVAIESDNADNDVGAAVLAYQNGDHRALGVLMAEFDRPMRCVARRYLICPQDIEDAVQDAWVAFAGSADRIHTPMAIGGWLCVTTARAALTISRRQARCRPSDVMQDASMVPVAAEIEDVDLDNASRTLRDAVGRLHDGDRELVRLLFDADMSYAEITARTGRALGGIGPTRSRVIEKLRRDTSIRALVAAHAS